MVQVPILSKHNLAESQLFHWHKHHSTYSKVSLLKCKQFKLMLLDHQFLRILTLLVHSLNLCHLNHQLHLLSILLVPQHLLSTTYHCKELLMEALRFLVIKLCGTKVNLLATLLNSKIIFNTKLLWQTVLLEVRFMDSSIELLTDKVLVSTLILLISKHQMYQTKWSLLLQHNQELTSELTGYNLIVVHL